MTSRPDDGGSAHHLNIGFILLACKLVSHMEPKFSDDNRFIFNKK
jgi:hypothetical protein